MSQSDAIVEKVTSFYLTSKDFNGMPASHLASRTAGDGWKDFVRPLVRASRIEVVTTDIEVNPSIKRLPVPSVEVQLRALDEATEPGWVCLYPHPSELASRVDRSKYEGKPYALALALGEPQLGHRGFDLRVLETYRSDPRYVYECDDLHGWISVSDEHYESDRMAERDKVLLQSFGFGFDEAFGRSVVAFSGDLADLTPEHQRIWQAYELTVPVRMHEDFFRSQVMGEFPKNLSLCQAFFMELETINAMAAAMRRPALFRNVERPKRFALLLRPTLHEFEQFVHLLDKTLSDNLDRKFFLDDVSFEREIPRKDGKIRVEQKGTLQLLQEWLELKVKAPDRQPLDEMMGTFREVRKLRQAPAHALNDDAFDAEIFRRQRKLLLAAYQAVRMLRLILTNHPAARIVEVDPFLYEGKILSY
jgi:hypothetical protein